MIYLFSVYSLSASAAVSFAAPIFINSFKALQLLLCCRPWQVLRAALGGAVCLPCPRSWAGFLCVVGAPAWLLRSSAVRLSPLRRQVLRAAVVVGSARAVVRASAGAVLVWSSSRPRAGGLGVVRGSDPAAAVLLFAILPNFNIIYKCHT